MSLPPGRPKGIPNCKVTAPMRVRMGQLRRIGLSVEAIRRVIKLDYGEHVTDTAIRNSDRHRHSTGFPDNGGPAGVAGLAVRGAEHCPTCKQRISP